jgi:hypothetical protein
MLQARVRVRDAEILTSPMTDFYFFFGGFHLLFSVYMIIGIPSTGSAGLIQTISMYSRGHIVGGIIGTVATVCWTAQGLGNAWYYREVVSQTLLCYFDSLLRLDLIVEDMGPSQPSWSFDQQGERY